MYDKTKKTNRRTKDTVFTDLFRDVKYQRKLYEALYGCEETLRDEDFKLITLENIFVRDFYNDLGLLVKGKLILLVEAQSTYNPNMALRFLLYIAHTYQNYIKENAIYLYGNKKVEIPEPSFYLLYTGEKEMREEDLALSSLYIGKKEKLLELKVKLITLEKVKKSILWEYIKFCKVFDEKKKGAKTEEELLFAIRETLGFCKENDILKEYLIKKEKEVEDFMIEIFTEEELEEMRKKYEEREKKEHFESGKEIGKEIGKELGEANKATDVAGKMRKRGFDIQTIMELTGLSKDKILGL